MDIVRNWSDKKKMRSKKYKELEEDYRLNKMLEDRQKSSNERELESYIKEERERKIKEQLDVVRKKKSKEMWKGNNMSGGKTILRNERPILKEKNIFKGSKTTILKNGGGSCL